MPRLHADVLALLRDREERFDAVVPKIGGHREPLCARYARRTLPIVRARIAAGDHKMAALLGHLVIEELAEEALRAVDPDLEFSSNVNTPEDVRRLGLRR
jgi:molybdopterin-guanine dinucleotide biosynthesis protein A